MPTRKVDGITPKWTATDPLGLFHGSGRGNLFVPLPRVTAPTWGEFRVPIRHVSTSESVFSDGINYMVNAPDTTLAADQTAAKNYVGAFDNGTPTFSTFATIYPLSPFSALPYNTVSGQYCGCRFFTDSRGLGRQGLELPPFYGIARLFSVYEVHDYATNHSQYDQAERTPTSGGTAINLLKQNFDGPTFWVEIDDDGDSTFILNADAIDITKSTFHPISSFATGAYAIEANVFGFDRGSFSPTVEFRFVLSQGAATKSGGVVPPSPRDVIVGPPLVIPGPLPVSSSVMINYSRTPYMGDAWGTQTGYSDIGYLEGPLTSPVAYTISGTPLDQTSLTRPNEKPLEVLASLGFVTSMGTGSLSGKVGDVQNIVGYEDLSDQGGVYYPPYDLQSSTSCHHHLRTQSSGWG